MTTNRELKNLLEIEENKVRYEATRDLLELEQSFPYTEPYTANDAAFDRIKLMAQKRAYPEDEYGIREGLSLLWAMRWSWILLIVLYLA
tara:strand:+ start:263 stop:529 length:267 start_codon:yes stop_codon:yes gene_type:complete